MKRPIPVWALMVVAFGGISCKRTPPSGNGESPATDAGLVRLPHELAELHNERTTVSMIELIARPKEFSGKRVRTEGYLRMRDEDMMLYVSEEFARSGLGTNSIAIQPAACSAKIEDVETLRHLDAVAEAYVSIVATFVIGDPRRLTFQVGKFCNIVEVTRLQTIPDAGYR